MKNVHIISHSHWDREWYMSFEEHRAKLVTLIDECIELFENDPNFKGFYLDGHTALVEDYLEIKPQNREKVERFIKEGKFKVGPWYILQDEFLTSGEANVRNLLVGMDLAEKLGGVTKVGYFPDAFGNAGQMPQILKQAGMSGIAFGRGVKGVGANNELLDDSEYSSKYSEIHWQSPDGSSLPSVVFMNWYSNGMEIPTENIEDYWKRALENAEKYASTDEILLMNGCDHQPVQTDLSLAIERAKEKYPEYNFIHSNFTDYIDAVTKAMPSDIKPIVGELTSQDTDGWYNLVNTASSLVDLKIQNRKSELLLEAVAEPLAAMTATLGKEYPHDMLLYAWKTLMKNHPHDSICSCSCDEVNAEVKSRFDRSNNAAKAIIDDSLEFLGKHIDTKGFEDCDAVFCVINTMAGKRNKLTKATVDVKRHYCRSGRELHEMLVQFDKELYMGGYELLDDKGNVVPCEVLNRKSAFGYDLPRRTFRKPYAAEQIEISFLAEDVPSSGYRVYGVRKTSDVAQKPTVEKNVLENKFLKAEINADGTVNLLDKLSGKTYRELLRFEDTGDCGHEYTYVQTKEEPILSGKTPAKIELSKNEEFVTEYKVTVTMEIPKEGDEVTKKMIDMHNPIFERDGAGRCDETVTMEIVSYISLSKESKSLDIRTELTNNAKDHRLRVLFPTGLDAKTHKVESVFELPTRNNEHKPCWTYPSKCEHQQGFVTMKDTDGGISVCNIGLYEYETLGNTIAVTLVRAVGELGDWGVFPTELSQVQKELTFEYSIVPFKNEEDAYCEVFGFQYPMITTQVFDFEGDALSNEMLIWCGTGLKQTAFKNKMNGNDIIARWTNYTDCEQTLTIKKTEIIDNLYRSNVVEDEMDVISCDNGEWKIKVRPFEILTVLVKK